LKWNNYPEHKPTVPKDEEFSQDYLITDGKHITIGYFEPEYWAENPEEPLQFSDEVWHQEGSILKTDCCGWPKVTHWAELPELPKD